MIHSREVKFFEGPDKQKGLEIRPEEINDKNSPPVSPEDVPAADDRRDNSDEEEFFDADGADDGQEGGEEEGEVEQQEEFDDENAEVEDHQVEPD